MNCGMSGLICRMDLNIVRCRTLSKTRDVKMVDMSTARTYAVVQLSKIKLYDVV